MTSGLLVLAAAWGQDVAAPSADVDVEEAGAVEVGAAVEAEPTEATTEIVVIGARPIPVARQAVLDELSDLGFTREKPHDGFVTLKHDTAWHGKVRVYDDGRVDHRRQGLQASTPEGALKEAAPALSWLPCVVRPDACFKAGGFVVSRRKLRPVEAAALTRTLEPRTQWNDAIADSRVLLLIEALPQRLEDCWVSGTPLEPAEALLSSPLSRRDHLVAWWATRTETRWGDAARAPVEAFLRAVVQDSEWAFSLEEADTFDETSPTGRSLAVALGLRDPKEP